MIFAHPKIRVHRGHRARRSAFRLKAELGRRDEHFRRPAYFVDRILNGAKPADLPIEQPTVFELIINLKTAKELGITIPPALMIQATEFIE